jgi:alpha-ketoglutarate-dependent taurine dioxygenase
MRPHPIQLGPASAIDFQAIQSAYAKHGALLLRGGKPDLESFEALTRHFCSEFHEVGTRRALRRQAGDGFTTEVFRDNFILLGHAEGAYRPCPPAPEVCFFMCVTPPAVAGGETTLVDGVEMAQALPAALRARLERVGVIYECLWEPARWQAEFGVDSEAALAAMLSAQPDCRFSLDAGVLHLFYSAPAITAPAAGASFVNGVLAHLPRIAHPRYAGLPVYARPTNRVYFGDGELLDDATVNALIDAYDSVVYRHRWQAGDVLFVDNARFMHGREMTAA